MASPAAGPYEKVADGLRQTAFSSIEYREETGSTNADAAALLGDPRSGGHTIVAEFQRQGMGRKGRTWQALAGSALLFTTILPREIETRRLWLVPFWTALAVRAALLRFGIAAVLQWPNDLLVGERKLGGILCASRVSGARARVACGVGINVGGAPPDAAFCNEVTPVDRPALLSAILEEFDSTLSLLDQSDAVKALWQTAAGLPGRRYRIALDGSKEPFEATALALADGGALRVKRSDDSEILVEMADARILR